MRSKILNFKSNIEIKVTTTLKKTLKCYCLRYNYNEYIEF